MIILLLIFVVFIIVMIKAIGGSSNSSNNKKQYIVRRGSCPSCGSPCTWYIDPETGSRSFRCDWCGDSN